MTYYSDFFPKRTYEELTRPYPGLQRRVFDVLSGMTPSHFQFLLSDLYKERPVKPDLGKLSNIEDAFEVIGDVLIEVLEDSHLLLTDGDIWFAWKRLREMHFLFQAVRQGIFIEEFDEAEGLRYKIKALGNPCAGAWVETMTKFKTKTRQKCRVKNR